MSNIIRWPAEPAVDSCHYNFTLTVMTVVILADTHIPDREQSFPATFRERIRNADHVIHAGDFTSPDTLETIQNLASNLTAVQGNVDRASMSLPEVATLTVGAVTFVVCHGTTPSPQAWLTHVAQQTREHAEPQRIGIGAHHHHVADREHDGVRLLNPGSATGAAPADRTTMLTAEVDDDAVDVTVHET